MSDLATEIARVITSFWMRVKSLYAQNSLILNRIVGIALLLAFVGSIVVLMYDRFGRRSITLLSGPDGSAGDRYASAVIAATKANPLNRITINPEATAGFEENRERIANDTRGNLIGFSHDGFGDSANVRILVPLDRSYLHIMCRRDFYRDLAACCEQVAQEPAPVDPREASRNRTQRTDGGPTSLPPLPGSTTAPIDRQAAYCAGCRPPSFYDLIYLYKNHGIGGNSRLPKGKRKLRVHLGEEKSGTRQIAASVLSHFRVAATEYHEVHAATWQSLWHKLRDGEVDIAFYVAPSNSREIQQLAIEDNAFLVSLASDAEAIVNDLGSPVSVDVFPAYQYGRRVRIENAEPFRSRPEVPYGDTGPEELREPEFCEEVSVLYTRRVLICSRAMDTATAYNIGLLARQALSNAFAKLGWLSDSDSEQPGEARFAFLLHPAAKLVRDDRSTPESWRDWIAAVAVPLLLLVVWRLFYMKTTQGHSGKNGSTGSDVAKPPPNAGAGEGLQEGAQGRVIVDGMISHLLNEVYLQEHGFSEYRKKQFLSRVRRINNEIKALQGSGALSDGDAAALDMKVQTELLPTIAGRSQ